MPAALRAAFAYGASTLVLVASLRELNFSQTRIGLFMTLTLVGDVAIGFVLALVADGVGRRAVLALGAALMIVSGVIFALGENYWVLLAAAVFGVISPRCVCLRTVHVSAAPHATEGFATGLSSGNEIGPFRAVEESTVAHLTDQNNRSDIYA